MMATEELNDTVIGEQTGVVIEVNDTKLSEGSHENQDESLKEHEVETDSKPKVIHSTRSTEYDGMDRKMPSHEEEIPNEIEMQEVQLSESNNDDNDSTNLNGVPQQTHHKEQSVDDTEETMQQQIWGEFVSTGTRAAEVSKVAWEETNRSVRSFFFSKDENKASTPSPLELDAAEKRLEQRREKYLQRRQKRREAQNQLQQQQQQQQQQIEENEDFFQRHDNEAPGNLFTTNGMRQRRTLSQQQQQQQQSKQNPSSNRHNRYELNDFPISDNDDDPTKRTHPFWRTYDDIVFLSLASQLGILFRIVSSTLMSSSSVFATDSALFTNLPLNCLSCLIMGLLCSGEDAWKVVSTRGGRRGFEELREVQLEAMERRMKRSQSLLLFPGKKEEGDLMEHYNQRNRNEDETQDEDTLHVSPLHSSSSRKYNMKASLSHVDSPNEEENESSEQTLTSEKPSQTTNSDTTSTSSGDSVTPPTHQLSRMNEETLYSIAHGWDTNTSPQAMSSDLLLGLRVGFCGALSTFSSWNSSMVNLLRTGHVGDAIVGYIIGFALPIVSYKIGVHIAVYFFVAKCRREKRREAKRGGYAIRLSNQNEEDDEIDEENGDRNKAAQNNSDPDEEQLNDTPSLRAIATAIFSIALISLTTSLYFFDKPNQQQFAISLLFSPLGVLCRWKLSKLNTYRPSFPLGTFCANMLGCLLSGSLGSLLAGNPGEEESIVLTSMISGFAGSLSTLATLVVQVLDLSDVVLYRLDGAIYAFVTIFWGFMIGLLTRSAVDWADEL